MMHLLRKELGELINKQMLLGLLATFLILITIGFVMTTTVSETMEHSGELYIVDLDDTDFTAQLTAALEEDGYTVHRAMEPIPDPTLGQIQTVIEKMDAKEAAVITKGFTQSVLEEGVAGEIYSVTTLETTSMLATMTVDTGSAALLAKKVESLLLEERLGDDQTFVMEPVKEIPYTIANGSIAQVDSMTLVSSMSLFDQLMPLILFLLVMLTSQTIITAVAAEKTDKTLEALLSSPAPRSTIIGAKMLAAFLVAVLYAVVYGLGMLLTMLITVSGNGSAESVDLGMALTEMAQVQQALTELGLQLPGYAWVLIIVQILLTICISLMVSMVLGAMVQDAKSAQNASLPIMFAVMFPYILSMVTDIRQLDLPVRLLLYCIPFTHTFIATGCMRFHEEGLFWGGLVYQAAFLVLITWLALRLYRSDFLFIGANFGKKKTTEQ